MNIINELQSRTIVPKEKTHEKTHIIISDLEDYSTKNKSTESNNSKKGKRKLLNSTYFKKGKTLQAYNDKTKQYKYQTKCCY